VATLGAPAARAGTTDASGNLDTARGWLGANGRDMEATGQLRRAWASLMNGAASSEDENPGLLVGDVDDGHLEQLHYAALDALFSGTIGQSVSGAEVQ
jgi:hypothetical protein